MNIKAVSLALLVSLTASASAQWFTDRFNYPPGTIVGGWKEECGDWTSTGRSAAVGRQLWHYATQPNFVLLIGIEIAMVAVAPFILSSSIMRGRRSSEPTRGPEPQTGVTSSGES